MWKHYIHNYFKQIVSLNIHSAVKYIQYMLYVILLEITSSVILRMVIFISYDEMKWNIDQSNESVLLTCRKPRSNYDLPLYFTFKRNCTFYSNAVKLFFI